MKKYKLMRKLKRARKLLKRAQDVGEMYHNLYDAMKRKYGPPDWTPLLSDGIQELVLIPEKFAVASRNLARDMTK